MANEISTTNPAGMSNLFRIQFEKTLKAARENQLVLAKYRDAYNTPMYVGTNNTIRFFLAPDPVSNAFAAPVNETTVYATNTEVAPSIVETTASTLYARATPTNEALSMAPFDLMKMYADFFGESAARQCDLEIAKAITTKLKDSDVISLSPEIFAGVTKTLDSSADFTSLVALSAGAAKIDEADILRAVHVLGEQGATRIGGAYVCALPYALQFDLLQDTGVRAPINYSAPESAFKGKLAMYAGIKFELTNNSMRETTYGTYAAAGDIHSAFVFGANSFACPTWDVASGSKNPFNPTFNYLNKPDKSDPNNQLAIIAAKFKWAQVVYRSRNVVQIRAKSTI